jgi:hypothetical protein
LGDQGFTSIRKNGHNLVTKVVKAFLTDSNRMKRMAERIIVQVSKLGT